MTRFQVTFGTLVLAQAAHSMEEYVGRLWESFPPARFLTGLISQDLERGFIVINVSLVAFGLLVLPVARASGMVVCRARRVGVGRGGGHQRNRPPALDVTPGPLHARGGHRPCAARLGSLPCASVAPHGWPDVRSRLTSP